MTLPEVALDDLRFQLLVNECRTRVVKLCPEWTEVNVSDPGITLIELFAWMTDQLSYRINRLPEKLHVALLALLDVHLYPASPARAELRFRLEQPATAAVPFPAWRTEASTPRTPGRDPIVFQTVQDFTLQPIELSAYLLQRAGEIVDVTVQQGEALPDGAERYAFDTKPRPGDCMLLGFNDHLDRLIVRIHVTCAPARGIGVVPSDPPLRWHAFATSGDWVPVERLSDTTEGFNMTEGYIELALPGGLGEHSIGGHRCQWLRCTVVDDKTAGGSGGEYTAPPSISELKATTIGATLPAQHAQRVNGEALGRSDGTPGQVFSVRNAPIVALDPQLGEFVEVAEPGRAPVRWTEVDTFAQSQPGDTHYRLDGTAGEVEFGPVVRQPDGSFKRFGAIPASGAEVRLSAYRRGGGTVGNVSAHSLAHLRHPIPGVQSVTNPKPAQGGVDGETLAAARARLAIELRTHDRAITASDFEQLCLVASRGSAVRAHCLADGPGSVRVLAVPRVDRPARPLSLDELTLDPATRIAIEEYLDNRRLVGVSVSVGAPRYRGVTAVVSVVAAPGTDAKGLQRLIEDRLHTYLNPVIGGNPAGSGSGWEFGRSLAHGELRPIVQAIEGVQQIHVLRVYPTDLSTGREEPAPLDGDLTLAPDELISSGMHRVRVEGAPGR
jgi:predicted phage baseplate assembly protein